MPISKPLLKRRVLVGSLLFFWASSLTLFLAQGAQEAPKQAAVSEKPKPKIRPNDAGSPIPTRAEMIRGAYGPFRANNDLLYYHLDIRVDPVEKFISGKNTIRFRMLKDDSRIQLDLTESLQIEKILLGTTQLKYVRDTGAVFVDFPETLKAGKEYSIDFYYSGIRWRRGVLAR